MTTNLFYLCRRGAPLAAGLGASLLFLMGCGGGEVIPPPAPTAAPVVAKPVAPTPDAYRDFKGERVVPNEVFRLKAKAKAVAVVEVVINMVKVQWTTRETPDGKNIKEGTAELVIQKGTESRTIRVEQDETKKTLGCQILVKAVGEDYDAKRFDYLPWVDLIVTPR